MRLRFRVLGADVFDFATGEDAKHIDDEATEEAGPGATSADLAVATPGFGVHGHDEQWFYPDDKRR